MLKKLLYLVALLAFANISRAAIHYVTVSGAGSQNGSSWSNASNDIQAMINLSSAGDQIWVVNGRYKPTHPANNVSTISVNNRNNAFVLKADVQLYGGFTGTETAVTQRDSIFNLTVLTGDLGIVGSDTDNAYHVVVASGSLGTAVLNSFAIKHGYADGLDSTSVNGNYVVQSAGGGIACRGSQLIVVNCLVDSNSANQGAGISNYQSMLNLVRSGLTNNAAMNLLTASALGGGIYNMQSSLTMTNCNIIGNVGSGGGIYNDLSSVNIVNSVIRLNSSYNLYYSYNAGAGILTHKSSTTISGSVINKNSGAQGAAVWDDSSSLLMIANSTVDSNSGQMAIAAFASSSVVFDNCSISYSAYIGFQCANVSPTITNSVFNYNGGNALNYSRTSGVISGCTFSHNARAIYLDSFSAPAINGCTIGNNVGSLLHEGGGMICTNYSSPVVTNCTITQNLTAIYANQYGGGVKNINHSSPSFTNCIISSNTAGANGYPNFGGGIYNGNFSSPTFTNCTITGNNALQQYYTSSYGGGICNENSSAPVFTRCTIASNGAGYGAGICNISASPATFTDCKISYNGLSISAFMGSGVYNDSSSSIFTNCLFNGNYGTQGTVYDIASSAPVFTNCTISNNKNASYGGILQWGGNVTVKNSIIWGNSSGVGIYLIPIATSNAVTQYSLIEGQNDTTNGNIAGSTNPLFTDTTAGNFKLLVGSPCINTASNAFYTGNLSADLDLGNGPRLVGTAIDMGPYEQCTGLPAITAQPTAATTCLNGTATFSAGLSSTNGLSFQWQQNGVNINGATNTIYTKSVSFSDTGWYKLIITSAVCGNLYSDSVKLMVKAPPAILQQPTDTTICAGGSFSLSGAASGSGLSYQWLKNGNPITGATTVTYIVTNAQIADSGSYTLKAMDSCGNTVTSQNVLATVHPIYTPTIIIATAHDTICQGTLATFAVATTYGGNTPNYQWYQNNNPMGGDSATCVYMPANGDVIKCILNSSLTCVDTAFVASNSIEMTVNPIVTPLVTISCGLGDSVLEGQQVIFTSSVVNGGAAPQYQWRKNNNNIPGATNDSYTTVAGTDFQGSDQISLSVRNTDACGADSVSTSLLMYVTPTGINNISNDDYHFSLYPNPNDGSFTIKGAATGCSNVTLEVYNMLGQNVYNEEAPVNNGQLNQKLNLEKSLPSGNYFLKINGVGTTVIRFAINKN
ncbi:right-handed parallel beta-helix repeat-containing protein [Taibaiella soli]|uniref:Ig-like domain-containing protein n=1 Tax=Taibaiella soli TaxID=1649169 RepID=A0A2W2AEI4_9BACT|nr:right-handed parallel beta-helix repeat-containing protein [Taibaiella soli]PZF73701.1 hypothetical protein DN068_06810 [Taibaiella soli]